MASVELSGISKAFGDTSVLNGIDLSIRDGEFLTLVGPSGCGKSTLIRIIAGLEAQDQGSVALGGTPVDDLRPARAACRDGVPELCAVPAHDRAREHRAAPGSVPASAMGACPRPSAPVEAPPGIMPEVDRRGRSDRTPAPYRGASRPSARPTLGRAAPARRARARHGSQAARLPDGRAALQSRCQAPRAHAKRARGAARAARRDVRLRHSRPSRSDDDVRPDRHDGCGTDPAARDAERALRAAGERQGRAVHRKPGDQLLARARGGWRRRRALRASAADRQSTCPLAPRLPSGCARRRSHLPARVHLPRPAQSPRTLLRKENLGPEFILHLAVGDARIPVVARIAAGPTLPEVDERVRAD